MFDRSCTRFHDNNFQKSGETFSLRRVERFYYREFRSSLVRKYRKTKQDLKSYGSAATISHDSYKQHLKEKWSNGHAVAPCSIKYHG